MSRYVNPFTDFGFRKLFGEEPNKEILIDFLNELLAGKEERIVDLRYLKNEHLASAKNDRRAIFDLYCESETGEKFIVELQKAKQRFFKDRALYYTTFPIQEQAKVNEWDYELKAVYLIAILDFVFEEDAADAERYRYDIQLVDVATCEVFYDKLTFVYLEMPKFRKPLEELSSRFEKWLYVIRNLDRLESVPPVLQERIFERLFEAAEIAHFDPSQREDYQESLKYYRDLKNSFDTARFEGHREGLGIGREEGREEAIKETIRNGLRLGLAPEALAKLTGLSTDRVQAIIAQLDAAD
jgi:predicted transposase/invertase (TIGR01784 family)